MTYVHYFIGGGSKMKMKRRLKWDEDALFDRALKYIEKAERLGVDLNELYDLVNIAVAVDQLAETCNTLLAREMVEFGDYYRTVLDKTQDLKRREEGLEEHLSYDVAMFAYDLRNMLIDRISRKLRRCGLR